MRHIAVRKNFTANRAEGFAASRETEQTHHDNKYRHGKPCDDRPTMWPEKQHSLDCPIESRRPRSSEPQPSYSTPFS
jgi:hypothetical protein